tara:strand:+ start:455 stop:760 length:306 start_codon:yes stop_codon:yes gene_type:complete
MSEANTQWSRTVTDQVGWVVLFIGTRFMDGRYTEKDSAMQIKEHMEERYPRLRFEVAQVRGDFLVSDDIFWADHQEEIEAANDSATGVYWRRHGYAKANSN